MRSLRDDQLPAIGLARSKRKWARSSHRPGWSDDRRGQHRNTGDKTAGWVKDRIPGILLKIQLVVYYVEVVIGIVLLRIGIWLILRIGLILGAVPICTVRIRVIHLRRCFVIP